MTDDQHGIEQRVLATMERTYHCAYCHSVWRETSSGKCKSCGSGSKLYNSHNNSYKKAPNDKNIY